ELARLLALSGDLNALQDLVTKWTDKDPLDADCLGARGDLAARRGESDEAVRILDGIAAARAGSPDAASALATLASSHERMSDGRACAFRVAVAQLRQDDPDAIARAVQCERARGNDAAADRWLVQAPSQAKRGQVDAALAKLSAGSVSTPNGDIVVSVTWD